MSETEHQRQKTPAAAFPKAANTSTLVSSIMGLCGLEFKFMKAGLAFNKIMRQVWKLSLPPTQHFSYVSSVCQIPLYLFPGQNTRDFFREG